MSWSTETWISIIIGIVPILGAIAKCLWKRFFSVKTKALTIEHIESKQYFHKKKDKIELKVIYNNTIACDAIVTLRISIKNTGKEDISHNALIDPIKLTFSDKYEILEVVRVREYEKIKPMIVYTANEIFLSWALLKHQRHFEIDIIAQNNLPEKDREFSVDFYNSMRCDLNIEGIDEILFNKKTTLNDKIIKRSRDTIIIVTIYAICLNLLAVLTKYGSDYDYQLLLQKDSTCISSPVSIYVKNNITEIKAFEEVIALEEFNNKYSIRGIPTDMPNKNQISFVVYLVVSIVCYIGACVLFIKHQRKKKRLRDSNKSCV